MDKNIFSIAKRIAEYLSGNEDIEGKQELEEWRKEYRNESLLQKITGDGWNRGVMMIFRVNRGGNNCRQNVCGYAAGGYTDDCRVVLLWLLCFLDWLSSS